MAFKRPIYLAVSWSLAFCILTDNPQAQTDLAVKSHSQETEAQKEERAKNPGNLIGHGGPVKAIAVSPSGNLALTGSFDYAMILWDVSSTTPKIRHRFDEHDAPVSAVAFLPGENRALAATDDGVVTLWDLEQKRALHRFKGHQSKVVSLAISQDGNTAASASWDRTARLWNLKDLTPGPILKNHGGPVNAVVFTSFEGRNVVYTASYDSRVLRWNATTGELERQLYKHGWGLNTLTALDGGNTLAFGSLRGETGLIDTDSGEQTKTLPSHEGPVLAQGKSRNEDLLVFAGGDGVINVWSLKEGTLLEQHTNPYGPVWSLALNKEANALYYAGLDDFATLWQIDPRKPFEPVAGKFPRRFQQSRGLSLGERQFQRKCSICHTLTPQGGSRAGPTLFGLFGRKAGSVKGYAYSKALKESDIVWNAKTIAALFEQGPDLFTPGSKMPLQKISDRKKRDALIAFIKTAGKENPGTETTPQSEMGVDKENNK